VSEGKQQQAGWGCRRRCSRELYSQGCHHARLFIVPTVYPAVSFPDHPVPELFALLALNTVLYFLPHL